MISPQVFMAIIWLVLFVVFVVVEFITQGITTIWFAGGSVVSLFASALNAPIWLQVTLFIVISVVLLVFTRPILLKYYDSKLIKTNVEAVVGETAVVTTTINNLSSEGQVQLKGMDWTARAINDLMIIAEGEKVIVRSVEGVKLIVEKQNY